MQCFFLKQQPSQVQIEPNLPLNRAFKWVFFLPGWAVDAARRAKNTRLRTNMTAPTSTGGFFSPLCGHFIWRIGSSCGIVSQSRQITATGLLDCPRSDVPLSVFIGYSVPLKLHLFHPKVAVGYSGLRKWKVMPAQKASRSAATWNQIVPYRRTLMQTQNRCCDHHLLKLSDDFDMLWIQITSLFVFFINNIL